MEHESNRVDAERFATDFSDAETTNVTFEKHQEAKSSSSAHSTRSQTEKPTTHTYTDIRPPQLNPPAPVLIISSAAGLAQEIVGEGFSASATRISSSGNEHLQVTETQHSQEKYLKEQENYRKEQEALVRKYEKAVEKMHEEYRKKTEQEAEKIRKEMEKQHERDIQFRKELMDKAIERQKEEIALEAKYARKELDRQREMAVDALDQTKNQTDVQVNIDTAAGHTVSESQSASHQVESEQTHDALEHQESHKSLGSKIKETFLGKSS